MLPTFDNKAIDICSTYIEDRDAHYLAKEGCVVYYASLSGRKSDYVWLSLTVAEVLRIIKATRMNQEDAQYLKEHHLISAFQELDKVYEFAVKSKHEVSEGIFNYYEHSKYDLSEQIMDAIVKILTVRQGFYCLLMNDVELLVYETLDQLGVKAGKRELRDSMIKHFEIAGFETCVGSLRVMYKGAKARAFMKPMSKPKDLQELGPAFIGAVARDIKKELE